MRVLVVLSSLYTGGAEFSTLSFYGWLIKRGYQVKVVCYKKASPAYDPALFGIEDVEYIKGNSFLQRLRSLNAIIKSFKPQLVHSVLFEANIIARFSRITLRNFVHLESLVNEVYSPFRLSDPNVTWFKLEGYRWFDRITQSLGVDHFHANGLSVANHYQDKLGIGMKRITVIPRGRKDNPLVGNQLNRKRVREELGTEDRVLFLNMARHEYQKGQDILLDALSRLHEDDKNKIQIVLMGREGKMTQVLKEKMKEHRVEKYVVLLGHRNDVCSLLAASDLFVFPSRFEGLPGALIEAEAAGLPIICSDIPNNREVAEEKRNAFFFAVNDSDKLAFQLKQLITDKYMRERMGTESLLIFNSRFTLEDIHIRMEALVLKLISGQH